MKSRNPVYKNIEDKLVDVDSSRVMTVGGTLGKLAIYLLMMFGGAFYSYIQLINGDFLGGNTTLFIGIMVTAVIIGFVTSFAPKIAFITAPVYAVLWGILLGAVSYATELEYSGIVLQAVVATLSITIVMFTLYATRIIKVNEGFIKKLLMAMISILVIYVIDMVLRLFGLNVPFLHEGGWIGIGVSLLIVGVASFNLLADFYFIETGAKNQYPKYMEAYHAFGFLVSLVWLYVEILDLIRKFRK